MNDTHEKLHDFAEDLRRSRDELRVEVTLAKYEIREEWLELEKQWEHFRQQLNQAGNEAAESSKDVSAALQILGEELKKGYQRIRKAL